MIHRCAASLVLVAALHTFAAPGDLDPSFRITNSFGSSVNVLAVQADGKILVGAAGGPNANALFRVNGDGSLDASFAPDFSGSQVNSIFIDQDNSILVGYDFAPLGRVVRLNTNGVRLTSSSEANGPVLAVQRDGRFIAGGNPISSQPLVRLMPDGQLDAGFAPQQIGAGIPTSILETAQGHVLAGPINMAGRIGLLRIRYDGKVDSSFGTPEGISLPWFDIKTSLLQQPDGRMLVAGSFVSVFGESRQGIARLHPSGAVDASFDPGYGAMQIRSTALQSDGRILIAGGFSSVDLIPRDRIARLMADGQLDANFLAEAVPSGVVNVVALQADGRILIGGSFGVIRLQNGPDSAPTIIHSPSSALITEGRDATLSIVAMGFPQPVFEWFHGDTVIHRSTHHELRLGPLTGAKVGNYRVVASNALGSATSAVATISMTAPSISAGRPVAGFRAGLDGHVRTLAELPDGKVIVGGRFNRVANSARTNLVVLNDDGSVDTSFDARFHAPFEVHVVRPVRDGIFVAGSSNITGQSMSWMYKLTYSGALISNYAPRLVVGTIHDLLPLPDGTTIISGRWSFGGTMRVGPDGLEHFLPRRPSLGAAFDLFPLRDGSIISMAEIGPHQRFDIHGTLFAPLPIRLVAQRDETAVLAPSRMVFSSGTTLHAYDNQVQDTNFQVNVSPGGDARITSQSDGKILVRGEFTNVNGIARYRIARLQGHGQVDTTFDPGDGPNAAITAMSVLGQHILAGGWFSEFDGLPTRGVAKLHIGTSTPPAFTSSVRMTLPGTLTNVPPVWGNLLRLESHPTGFPPPSLRWFHGGRLVGESSWLELPNLYPSNGGVYTLVASNIGGIETTHFILPLTNIAVHPGAVDFEFGTGPGANGSVRAMGLQSNGDIVIGGNFTRYDNQWRANLARLDADGRVDPAFNPGEGPDSPVECIAIDSQDRILLGGGFKQVDGQPRMGIARLNTAGTLDPEFTVNIEKGAVTSLLVVEDAILVGGSFTHVNAQRHEGIARLFHSGSIDPTFNVNVGGTVHDMRRDRSGRLYIVGAFTNVNGMPRRNVARFLSTGGLDPGYAPEVNGPVLCVTPLHGGRAYIGGDFTNVAGIVRTRIALLNPSGEPKPGFDPGTFANRAIQKIHVEEDERIIALGHFEEVAPGPDPISNADTLLIRSGVARLLRDGSLDPEFKTILPRFGNTAPGKGIVPVSDGRYLIHGSFNRANGIQRSGVIRILGSFKFLSATSINGSALFTIPTLPGRNYTMESAPAVHSEWHPVASFTAWSRRHALGVTPTNEMHLFRARLHEP